MLVIAYRRLSLLIVADRCLSLLVVAHRCLSLLIVEYRCISLLVVAYRSSVSRSIAAQVTGSGESLRESFVGEFTNSCEARGKGV